MGADSWHPAKWESEGRDLNLSFLKAEVLCNRRVVFP